MLLNNNELKISINQKELKMASEIPNGIHKTALDKLIKKKIKIAEMAHDDSSDLSEKRIIFRRPLVGKHEEGKVEDRISAFVIKGYENAIIIQLGKTIGTIREGVYEIDKDFQYTGTEIIWIDTTEFKTRWGLSDIYLKDNIKIGAYGSLIVKIFNPKNFILNIVSGKHIVNRKDVDNFIFEHVVQTYKEILGEFTIDDVIRNRETIKQKEQAKLYDLLTHWGIEVINLEIEGFKLPVQYEDLGNIVMEGKIKAGKKTQIKEDKAFDREQGVLDAQAGYEKAKMEAETKKVKGEVETELLEKESVAKVAGEVKIIRAKGEVEKELEEKREQKNQQIRREIAELKQKLDKFDDMLAEGKITQEIYKMRVIRIEKDLKELESKLLE
jgi:hypothetical protein